MSTVLWACAFLFFRTGIIPLREIDLSEIEIIEREKELRPAEKILPWYRVLV